MSPSCSAHPPPQIPATRSGTLPSSPHQAWPTRCSPTCGRNSKFSASITSSCLGSDPRAAPAQPCPIPNGTKAPPWVHLQFPKEVSYENQVFQCGSRDVRLLQVPKSTSSCCPRSSWPAGQDQRPHHIFGR